MSSYDALLAKAKDLLDERDLAEWFFANSDTLRIDRMRGGYGPHCYNVLRRLPPEDGHKGERWVIIGHDYENAFAALGRARAKLHSEAIIGGLAGAKPRG
jgi:hypothetical protein